MVKKRDRSISKKYSPVKLYLDHLEQLEEIAKENSYSVSIKTRDYLYDSVEDLRNNIKRAWLTELDVDLGGWYARIHFGRVYSSLEVSTEETGGAGIFYKLDRVISGAERTPRLLYNGWVIWLTSILIAYLLLPLMFITAVKSSRLYFYCLLSLIALALAWVIWALWVQFRRHGVIVLTYKHNETSFFQRNKDSLILAAISALLGATLGVIATLVISRLQNK